jgi:phage gp36-like protein
MNKYVVKVSSVFSNIIEVEAEDEQGARAKAQETLEDKSAKADGSLKHYYESTLPPENWPVISQEKYEKLKQEVKEAVDKKIAEEHEPN